MPTFNRLRARMNEQVRREQRQKDTMSKKSRAPKQDTTMSSLMAAVANVPPAQPEPKVLTETRRYLIVKTPGANGVELGRVETTNCPWCTDDAVCTACSGRADSIRALHTIKPGREMLDPLNRHVTVIGKGIDPTTGAYVEVKVKGSYAATVRYPPTTLRPIPE